ncbi:MAG: hypothetical protein MH472_07885 [Bacteroidia bacterium]|nr:hypothetical protein [Bacteroidia bacterium]
MKKLVLTYLLGLPIVLLFSNKLMAQGRDSLIKDNQIDVIKNFKPVLSDAIKIPVNPNPETPSFEKQVFTYSVPEQTYTASPTLYTIKPLSLGTMLLPKLKGNYIKAGFGNYLMPIGEIYLNTVRNKDLQAGFFYKHHSANGDVNYNNFSQNTVYGYAKKFTGKATYGTDWYYHRNVVNLYGKPNDIVKLPADPTLAYNLIDGKTFYQNHAKDSKDLVHKVEANYYHFSRSKAFNENDFHAKARIAQLNASIPFELGTAFRLNNNKLLFGGNELNYQRIFFDINPQLFMIDKDFYLQGGFNSTISSDSAGGKFHFFPKAEGGYNIIPNKLVVYAGLTGGLNPNTFRSVNSLNPFVSQFDLKNTIHKIEVYGGLKGEIGPQTSFYINSSSVSIENLVTYVTDSASANQEVVYGDAKRTTLGLGVQHMTGDKLRVGLHAQFNSYTTSKIEKAFSLPTLETRLNLAYNMSDKFLVKLDIFYWGERFGGISSNNPTDGLRTTKVVKLDPFVDLNLGVDYRYSKNLSAFIMLNNIANGRYQRFANYPVYGFNLIGGFTFTF